MSSPTVSSYPIFLSFIRLAPTYYRYTVVQRNIFCPLIIYVYFLLVLFSTPFHKIFSDHQITYYRTIFECFFYLRNPSNSSPIFCSYCSIMIKKYLLPFIIVGLTYFVISNKLIRVLSKIISTGFFW